DPATAPAISGAASAAPASSTTGWNGVQVTHRASLLGGKAVDDLIVHAKGDPQLYLYKNDGHGNFTDRISFYKSGTPSNTAVTCQDINGATITCPADFGGTDWSTSTQILALGTPGGETTTGPNGTTVLTQTALLAVIGGRLWLFPPGTSSAQLLAPADREVSTANTWDNYDLIGPGPANGDNQPTLWARDRAAGTIHAYPLTKNADGTVHYSALADPTTGTITNTSGVTPAAFPTVGSSGDVTGDGIPDLWAVRADGKLIVWPGKSTDGTPNTAIATFGSGTALADLRAPLGHWRLNDATGSTTAADSTGQHPLTVQGAAFGPDTVNGKTATVAAFNGTTSAMTSTGSTVNTSQSFTVTAWARATASGGVVISQDGTNASAFQLWPSNIGGGKAEWKFGMAASDTPNATVDVTDTSNAGALVQYNVWQQLTASYNADTSELLLYVNGSLASTGLHKSTWQAAGPTVVGRFKQNGSPAAFFNGSVAEVSAYQFASAPTTASATAVQSGTNPVKCIDNQNGQTTDGNPVQIWDCYPGIAAQSWNINTNGTVTNQGRCLDADHGTPANGTHVLLWTCNGGSNQQWLPTGTGALYNPATGRCLDDPDATTTNGTQLQVWDCYNIPAQHWSVSNYIPVPLAPLPGT
ncbi:ricin-type beta-trefoil lectin domain protein, partial [Saccharothrix sp. ST-888]|uniref:ricin-type beta-trefoil lectin domain protein n=1 Tax=Saccharothrix sp. ST-888 TaxID=1427391 RepID=UPI000A9115D5